MEDKPCCAQAAAANIKHLVIGGTQIGLSQLDEVMAETMALGLRSDAEIGETLLKKVKIYNYVPSSASSEYKRALLEEYCRRVRSC